MNAPAWSKEFERQLPVEQSYVAGDDEQVALTDNLDTLIIPLRSVAFSAFPGTAATEMSAGSMVFIPAGTCRAVDFSGRFHMILVKTPPALRHEVKGSSRPAALRLSPRIHVVNSPQQINAIVQLFRRITAAGDECTRSCLLSIARLLLWEVALSQEYERKCAPIRRRILDSGKIRAIDRFVEDNLEEPLSLEQLAQQAGMSRYYFLRSFKEATGLSPLQYIITKRVERAREMLQQGSESIAEIAYATGFSSQSHLNLAFKRHFGVTPGSYKREYRIAS